MRIFFITDVKNSARRSYERDLSEADSKRYAQFLKNFQNPMTKFNREVQIAHIRASARVAKYLIKYEPHLKSQKLLEKIVTGV